jgi:hypothetical protein
MAVARDGADKQVTGAVLGRAVMKAYGTIDHVE